MEQTVRQPAVAGQFYTRNPEALRAEVEGYLAKAGKPEIDGAVIALVSPHAGYMYSGQVAAFGFSLVRDLDYETVVVISPSHVEYFGYSSVFAGRAYATPLGEIPIDRELAEQIAGMNDLVKVDLAGHEVRGSRGEHSLEVQLPFLQVALGDFKLVPIVMGDQRSQNIQALGEALGKALSGRRALIVASTDLSHFHNGQTAESLDRVFLDALEAFDHEDLYAALEGNKTEACGGGPTAAAMIAARMLGAKHCRVLKYADSGDISGDKSSVVGYVSAVMLGAAEDRSGSNETGRSHGNNNPGHGTDLSRDDKLFLLALARGMIESRFSGESYAPPPPANPVMNEPRGGFVTLKKHGQLRGCIGYIEAIKPLIETVQEMANAAAFNDHRFSPVTAEEIPDLEIEISVLSPIETIDDVSLIEVGKHGIIITKGMNRGLLLPQVATEWGWDRETFLDQTCIKAGLPQGTWKETGTRIEIFSAEIFSEKELGLR
jgi:AmmeMemoRadiSam system protein B/AmmeMemoRadiSam system protein A